MIRVKLKISIFALIDSISLINQRTMTIQQLEYILAVDQFRHFAKAAEKDATYFECDDPEAGGRIGSEAVRPQYDSGLSHCHR